MAKAAYVVTVGRKPGVYEDWLDVSEQTRGVKNACQRGYDSLEEAKAAFRQKLAEGKTVAVPDFDDPDPPSPDNDPDDDVPVMPSAASRGARSAHGSSKHGSSTPASSASAAARGAPARERAPPSQAPGRSSTRMMQQQRSPTPTESEEDGARGVRGKGGERPGRHDAPLRAQVKREKVHAKEPIAGRARESDRIREDSTRAPKMKKQMRHAESPVPIMTDTDSDAPPSVRTSIRRQAKSRDTPANAGADSDSGSLSYYTPAWDESISNPSRTMRSSARHRASAQNTAPDAPQQDEPSSARHSRSSSSLSTSSSPPTSVSQYEDPEGGFSFHEFRNAARRAEVRKATTSTKLSAVDARLGNMGIEEGIRPSAREAKTESSATPARTATLQRRSRTEPASSPAWTHSPVIPTPKGLAKSFSMPTAANFSFRYKVCRGCSQPEPEPPLSSPVELVGSYCDRCLQPKSGSSVSGAPSPSPLRKSATYDAGSFKSKRSPASDTSRNMSGDVPNVQIRPNGDLPAKPDDGDIFGFCGLSSALPMPSFTLDGSRDPRSPIRGSASLPVVEATSFHRPSPTPSVDGRRGSGIRRSKLMG